MNIKKVKLPKEVAEAIDRVRGTGISDADFIRDHVDSTSDWVHTPVLNGFPLDTLIRALYIGYEVKMNILETGTNNECN